MKIVNPARLSALPIPLNPILFYAGILLVLLGVFHIFVQLALPREWESVIGWRKPILFGISTGITLVSLAWITAVTVKKSARLIAGVIAVPAISEVVIITVQTWRSVPAHFNRGEFIDKTLSLTIDGMLVFITLGIFFLTWKTLNFKGAESDWRSAMRLGMVFLAVACLLGFGVAIYGNYALITGADPEIVSPRGVPKFVHGMPLHALQILPLWLWFTGFFNSNVESRKVSVRFAAITIATTTVYAFWQTVNGFGRFELNSIGLLLIIITATCGGFALFFGLRRKTQ